jgi:16S rRNA (cytosine1402-N4)-methyltransferase
MPTEILTAMQVSPGGRYVDCTLGEGGHTAVILEASAPTGKVLGIETDSEALKVANKRFETVPSNRVTMIHGSYTNIGAIAGSQFPESINGVLMDLGISSFQLESSSRGFTFQKDQPLDMRFNPEQGITAEHIVNHWDEQDLANAIYSYGEERYARQIARAICSQRPLSTTGELSALISNMRKRGRQAPIHPATRTFQALRIVVNQEMQNIKEGLNQCLVLLETGARIAVISYHSLEDRIIKRFFRDESKSCLCPKEVVICECNHIARLKIVEKKPLRPTLTEINSNRRSRSAKLRVAEII